MSHRANRQLQVSGLARVEGEGALHVSVRDGRVEHVAMRIYEPPRFFEAFLRGRAFTEPPDITARICGICPVAYQLSACAAIEDVCGVEVGGQLAALRRLLYCGEWISSHALHIYLLHAPDFLGYEDAITLAKDHREVVERGLALKKAGNAIMDLVGGRAIHPINVRLGGFYRAPTRAELAPLAEQLRTALDQAIATAIWVSTFDFPDLALTHELLALHEPDRYAIESGTPRTASGATWPLAEWRSSREPVSATARRRLPRGLLYHRYRIDEQGLITSATIVPPTAQNQAAIETDLARLVQANLHLDDHTLTHLCEQAIRNHDPCISCSAHFLELTMDRQ